MFVPCFIQSTHFVATAILCLFLPLRLVGLVGIQVTTGTHCGHPGSLELTNCNFPACTRLFRSVPVVCTYHHILQLVSLRVPVFVYLSLCVPVIVYLKLQSLQLNSSVRGLGPTKFVV